ncbi:MAG: chromosome partitioning protein ParB [Rhodospirillaceae bacterium]|nr:MAG: chromosome partitioning protein ParB [Rhodospirillaceae bacterium]
MTFENKAIPIAEIYVPTKWKKVLNPETVEEIANAMLEGDRMSPIMIRKGKGRYVLVEGLHRLEACKAVGEETILAVLVQARKF